MEYRAIGTSGLHIRPLMFGGNVFGWTVDKAMSFRLLDMFVERGFNAIDTADVYSIFGGTAPGASETIIGEWLAQGGGRRDKIMLSTKFGLEMGPGMQGLSAAYVEQAVEASLRRLQTDRIDLYVTHFDDGTTPPEETLGALSRLIGAGKVRAIGASNYTPERLEQALRVAPDDGAADKGAASYQSLQPLYNLYDRAGYEAGLRPLCRKHGLAVFPYFALASGFLTGKYRTPADLEGMARKDLVARYLDERGLRILAAMDGIVAQRAITPAQIALAWLLAHEDVTAPVVSASRPDQLEQIMAAVDIQLSAAELALLNQASAEKGANGDDANKAG